MAENLTILLPSPSFSHQNWRPSLCSMLHRRQIRNSASFLQPSTLDLSKNNQLSTTTIHRHHLVFRISHAFTRASILPNESLITLTTPIDPSIRQNSLYNKFSQFPSLSLSLHISPNRALFQLLAWRSVLLCCGVLTYTFLVDITPFFPIPTSHRLIKYIELPHTHTRTHSHAGLVG